MSKTDFLGLDLSLRSTGYCVTSSALSHKYRKVGLIENEGCPDSFRDRFEMYRQIAGKISNIIEKYNVKYVAVEHYSFGSKGSRRIQLIESGSLVRWMIWKKGDVKLIEVAPIQLKKFITGSGRSDKNIICREIWKRWKLNIDGDRADAFGLAELANLYFILTEIKNPSYKSWYGFQIEVIESIIKKEREKLKT